MCGPQAGPPPSFLTTICWLLPTYADPRLPSTRHSGCSCAFVFSIIGPFIAGLTARHAFDATPRLPDMSQAHHNHDGPAPLTTGFNPPAALLPAPGLRPAFCFCGWAPARPLCLYVQVCRGLACLLATTPHALQPAAPTAHPPRPHTDAVPSWTPHLPRAPSPVPRGRGFCSPPHAHISPRHIALGFVGMPRFGTPGSGLCSHIWLCAVL